MAEEHPDRRRPAQHASRRDDALRRWARDEVHAFSRELRPVLDRAGLGRDGVRTAADLARLPVVDVASLGDGRRHVLVPTLDRLAEVAGPVARGRLALARALGREEDEVRHLDDGWKPIRWTVAPGGLLTGWTRADLDVLAELGRRALSVSGVRPEDRVLAVGEPPGVGPVQLDEGTRDAGVPLLRAPTSDAVAALSAASPTVVAGTPGDVADLVADAAGEGGPGLPDGVRLLVLHVGTADDLDRARAVADAIGLPASLWWAPVGVRAAWASCPGPGEPAAAGFHTWPEHEHLEVLGDDGRPARGAGRLVWTPIGWRGTVWLRVDLGTTGEVDPVPCPRCGRTTPRVRPASVDAGAPDAGSRDAGSPDVAAALAGVPDLVDWLVVTRPDGDRLLVGPARRDVAAAVRAAAAAASGLPATVLAPDRMAAARRAAGPARRVDAAVVAPALRRDARA